MESREERKKRLREKLEENPSLPKYLLTVRGLGYKAVLK